MSTPSILENLLQASKLLEKVTDALKSEARLSQEEVKHLKEVMNVINRFRKLYVANLVNNGQSAEAAEIFDVTIARAHHIKKEVAVFRKHGRAKPGTFIEEVSGWGNRVIYRYGRDEMPYRLKLVNKFAVPTQQVGQVTPVTAITAEAGIAEVLSECWHVVGEIRDRLNADLQALGALDSRNAASRYALNTEQAQQRIEAKTPAYVYRNKITQVWFYADSGTLAALPYLHEWVSAQLLMSPSAFVARHEARLVDSKQLTIIDAMLALDNARSGWSVAVLC